jgi:intracellular sulfur oxidation DsrE/DsrF family protein
MSRIRFIPVFSVLASGMILLTLGMAIGHAAEAPAPQPSLPLHFHQIKGFGSAVELPAAEERPRAGGKVYFDTTAAAPAGKPNRGLDSAARLVNLYALEGMKEVRPQIAVILHFNATAAALSDSAQERAGGGSNPNRELVEQLLANGVEVWVCGQSVVRSGHALADVLPGVRIAHSAMVFNINRPADGWTTIGVY